MSFEETQRNKAVALTTSIPAYIYAEIKASKTSFNSLILRAWAERDGFKGLKERLSDDEESTQRLLKNVARLQKVIFDLTEKIDELEKGGPSA